MTTRRSTTGTARKARSAKSAAPATPTEGTESLARALSAGIVEVVPEVEAKAEAAVLAPKATALPMAELIAGVRAYAERNYNRQGWDYVVEAYDDETLADMIYKARTVEGAISNVRRFVKVADEVRSDIQATAF